MTRYPKAGKGKPWTVRELECIPTDWQGNTLTDGGGLFGEVRLTKAGAVSVRFRYRFRWDGKARWYQCGVWPAIPLAQIRKERDKARQQVAEGYNPTLAKKAAKIERAAAVAATVAKEQAARINGLTVSGLFHEWIKDGVARADGNAILSSRFVRFVLPAIGNKPLSLLTDKDLLGVLRQAKEQLEQTKKAKGGNSLVAMLAKDIKQMLYWAEKRQPWHSLLAAGNPADLIDAKNLLDADYLGYRDRVLTADEIRTLHTALSQPLATQYKEDIFALRIRFAIWLCLSTICRIGELVQAKWEHIDWQAGTWLIPAANTKGKRGKRQSQLVILSAFALNQFRQLHAETGSSAYCFPVAKGDRPMIAVRASGQAGRHQGVSGLLPALAGGRWTLHDMRRTGATMMQSLGIPLEIIDRCQNHVLAGSRVRRHYMHYDYAKEKGAAWRALGEHLEAIVQGQQSLDLKQ